MQPDNQADVCSCGCQSFRPPTHNTRLIPSTSVIAAGVAKGMGKAFAPTDEPNDAISAALKAADERLAPFRDEVLKNGL